MKDHVKKKLVISLNPSEYYLLKEVLIDQSKEKALNFINEVLQPKLKQLEKQGCVPVFEASYKPGQKDEFKKK
ncbi:MAG: hypothetical protein H5T85_04290 [Actinobacteria bacterium]|nr:hypothetical protein [Actinomycetota bacterium]